MACDHQWKLKYGVFGAKIVCTECGNKRHVRGRMLVPILTLTLDYFIWPEINAAMATSYTPFLQADATRFIAEALLLALSWTALSALHYGVARLAIHKRGQVPEAWLGDF